ncbi:MAG: helix-turn-helix domain-containing protein [Acetobacteraceae bacterium]
MSELPPIPFTPETLAERWRCSPDQIRALCRRGRLSSFRIGRGLFRVPAAAVAAYEARGCDSSSIAAGGMPSGERMEKRAGGRSAPKIVMLPPAR